MPSDAAFGYFWSFGFGGLGFRGRGWKTVRESRQSVQCTSTKKMTPRLHPRQTPFSSRERGFANPTFEPRTGLCEPPFSSRERGFANPHFRAENGGKPHFRAKNGGLQTPIFEPKTEACKPPLSSREWGFANPHFRAENENVGQNKAKRRRIRPKGFKNNFTHAGVGNARVLNRVLYVGKLS